MFTLEDVETIELNEDASSEEHFQSVQRAINSGMWALQGSYGRTMMEAINEGLCMLGESSARDYYGNFIPSRYDVKEGTKGSAQFVEDNHGADWLQAMQEA
jgi:hypothetical protein